MLLIGLITVTGRFANVSVRQRPVRQRMKSVRQRLCQFANAYMSVCQHPKTPFSLKIIYNLDNLQFTS